jgi:hypothetical protein
MSDARSITDTLIEPPQPHDTMGDPPE